MVLHDVADYNIRKRKVELLKDRLEALVSPKLIAAFNSHSLGLCVCVCVRACVRACVCVTTPVTPTLINSINFSLLYLFRVIRMLNYILFVCSLYRVLEEHVGSAFLVRDSFIIIYLCPFGVVRIC